MRGPFGARPSTLGLGKAILRRDVRLWTTARPAFVGHAPHGISPETLACCQHPETQPISVCITTLVNVWTDHKLSANDNIVQRKINTPTLIRHRRADRIDCDHKIRPHACIGIYTVKYSRNPVNSSAGVLRRRVVRSTSDRLFSISRVTRVRGMSMYDGGNNNPWPPCSRRPIDRRQTTTGSFDKVRSGRTRLVSRMNDVHCGSAMRTRLFIPRELLNALSNAVCSFV